MEETSIKKALEDVILDITWAKVSKRYFGKTASWIYHKIAGYDGVKKVEFTAEERETLRGALIDLAERLRTAAEKI